MNAPSASDSTPRPANRLGAEASPYLRQHAHNPVDWLPWGEEAFERARTLDRPIFLSIGYSTCHWCHVMERETFANDAVAQLLNERFVSIKVDREERPDLDKIHMLFVQSTPGGGGWPLNVFLTPDRQPFFGGTYWPPESRQGRPGFPEVLDRIHELWTTRRSDLLESARQLTDQLRSLLTHSADNAYPAGERELHGAGQTFLQEYDPVNGGFGTAPKFPRPSQPLFLLRFGRRFADPYAIQAVEHTCTAMAAGGIQDQLGGGFARYSVDENWGIRNQRPRPHRDDKIVTSWNGMMIGALARASVLLDEPEFREAAERALQFLRMHSWDAETRTLSNSWCDGRRESTQWLDAYANLLQGVIDLYEATLIPSHLEFATELAEAMIERFQDTVAGGFWQTAAEAPDLILRTKEDYDGAEPSGNSVAALALLRLAAICGRADWRQTAERAIRLFAQRLHQYPQAVPHLLLALDFAMQEPKRVVLVGDPSCGSTAALLRAAHGVFEPHRVILGNLGLVEASARALPVNEEFTLAYCCSGSACQEPTRDGEAVRRFLAAPDPETAAPGGGA